MNGWNSTFSLGKCLALGANGTALYTQRTLQRTGIFMFTAYRPSADPPATPAALGFGAVPALQTARFAVRIGRESGTADFTHACCQVSANVLNANETSSPYDGAAVH
jgi:hypothetical protein